MQFIFGFWYPAKALWIDVWITGHDKLFMFLYSVKEDAG